MSSDEDEGDGRRYNRYESDDEGDVEGTYDEDAWNDSRKRRRGQTKEQAIYGIFGDDDDDGDDRDDRGAPVDYTAPVNFKSAGGTGGGGAGLGAGKEPEDMFADDDDDAPPTAGLGARGASEAAPGSGRSRPRAARGWASGASPRVTRSPRRWRTTRRRRGRRAGARLRRRWHGLRLCRRRLRRRWLRRGRRTGRGRAQPHGRRRERQRRRGSPAQHVRTEVRAPDPPDFSPTFPSR